MITLDSTLSSAREAGVVCPYICAGRWMLNDCGTDRLKSDIG